MGTYTINDDPAADQAVKYVLDLVAEGILDLMGNHVQAIVLTGGYGRGEGGVYENEEGYQLVNDLDIIIFVGGNYSRIRRKYNSLMEKLSVDLLPHAKGLKQIDISITNSWLYRFVPNLVNYYEMKNGYKTIYGVMDLSKIMPDLKAENLPVFDGTIYFASRGSGMLLPAIYFLTNNLDDPKIRENFQIEMQKACLAMGDAFLLLAGQYHYSYQERLKRLKNFKKSNIVVPESLLRDVTLLYCWGAKRKLSPSFEWMGNKSMIEKWFEVRNTFVDFFFWFECRRLNKNFKDWLDYSAYIHEKGIAEPWDVKLRNFLSEGRALMRNCKGRVRKKSRKDHLSVMPLLLSSLQQNTIDNKSLLQACNLLEVTSEKENVAAWLDATKKYLSNWHPAGIVKEAVALKSGDDYGKKYR